MMTGIGSTQQSMLIERMQHMWCVRTCSLLLPSSSIFFLHLLHLICFYLPLPHLFHFAFSSSHFPINVSFSVLFSTSNMYIIYACSLIAMVEHSLSLLPSLCLSLSLSILLSLTHSLSLSLSLTLLSTHAHTYIYTHISIILIMFVTLFTILFYPL